MKEWVRESVGCWVKFVIFLARHENEAKKRFAKRLTVSYLKIDLIMTFNLKMTLQYKIDTARLCPLSHEVQELHQNIFIGNEMLCIALAWIWNDVERNI